MNARHDMSATASVPAEIDTETDTPAGLEALSLDAAAQSAGLAEAGGPSLGLQAYEALVDLILSRELKQGEAVQERALAGRLGISRTPLREAMHRLEGERVLERKGNGRLYVRLVTVQEIMEVLHVRRLLESDAAARAAGKLPAGVATELRARIDALMQRDDAADPEHQRLDGRLHGLITDHCDNQLLAGMILELRRKTRMFSLKRMDNRAHPTCLEHLAILEALEQGDGVAAAAATARHIDNIRQAIIDKLLG
ncbi:GntR family transcriptional regulator [Herbaspirillum sp. NPDC087042]|uniref:GntR family transcriptional regulator n=1 Tax=Herbaspirillum sp. NPDC087042 TaxID=3364004 RepID=UPI0037F6C395